MTISVVIPAYNEERYLPKTLESFKHLDRIPDEVIVVDGASTDKTPAVARTHGAKVIIVKHSTIGYARQKGLLFSKGDIVAFTDADTIVPRDWLSKIEETLSEPRVVGVFGTFRVPDGWWPYRAFINYFQPWLNQIWYWFGVPMAPGQNSAFLRKKAIEAGGYPEEFKIAEDIEMMRRLMRIGKVKLRQDLIVISSGRRGNEGPQMFSRIFKAFIYYFIFRRADRIGFPDVR